MKKLLLATAALVALSLPASADDISLNAFVDGVLVSSSSSADCTLSIDNQAFGTVFNLNSLSINSQTFLAQPDIFSTNTLNVNQAIGGNHQLVIDIKANNLVGTNTVQNILSSFSVTGLTGGWNAQEQTFINGALLSDTGVFTATSDSAFETLMALLTDPYTAEVKYTINSVGTGRFNGGIDMALAPVPLPATIWLFGGGLAGIGAMMRRRKKKSTGQLALA